MFHEEGASTERTGTAESRSAAITAGKGSRMGPEKEKPERLRSGSYSHDTKYIRFVAIGNMAADSIVNPTKDSINDIIRLFECFRKIVDKVYVQVS